MGAAHDSSWLVAGTMAALGGVLVTQAILESAASVATLNAAASGATVMRATTSEEHGAGASGCDPVIGTHHIAHPR
jgi:hypothetical protein